MVDVHIFLLILFSHNVRIRSFSGLYFPAVRMRKNMDQKKSEYGHFSCSVLQYVKLYQHYS